MIVISYVVFTIGCVIIQLLHHSWYVVGWVWGTFSILRIIKLYRVKLNNDVELRLGNNILPGWICKSCKAFNGEAKIELKNCRACGAEK